MARRGTPKNAGSRKRRGTSSRSTRQGSSRAGRTTRSPEAAIEDLAATLVKGGDELITIEDPLEAEVWASTVLGTFYKLDAPLEARSDLDRYLWPAVVRQALARGDQAGRAVLETLAAMGDGSLVADARAAADELAARDVPAPAWSEHLGTAVFDDAWVISDVYGDQEAYYARFHHPGRPPHLINALYDRALGDIIKDAFAGYMKTSPEVILAEAREPGTAAAKVDPGAMARRVIDAIDSGDQFIDNHWAPDFRRFRALLLARMRSLPADPPGEPAEPLDDDARDALISDFLVSAEGRLSEDADLIASYCLDYSVDYQGDDGLRWSPIVVEGFMLDFLPRKVSLTLPELDHLPADLREWVRFALARRGLAEEWIAETQAAVDEHTVAFRSAMTDANQFGPAKSIVNAMIADGIDPLDEAAVDRWIQELNQG